MFICARSDEVSKGDPSPLQSNGDRSLKDKVSLSVHDALSLATAFEANKYLSLVSAIQVVWTASNQRRRPPAIRTRRFVIHAKVSWLL